jgi:hypothetical protein
MRSWLALSWKWLLLLLPLLAMLPQSALALTAGQVYEQVKDSVVVVRVGDQQGRQMGFGSGVMLPSGDIITNYHVVKEAAMYTVGRGRQYHLATLKAVDPEKDLCLLTAHGLVAEPARLGKAAKLKVGDPVYAVGAPQGLELSLSEGIISQLRGGYPPIIQTTVAISPGSSGGGLFTAKGELVGITTFYMKDGQSLNFALPVEWIGEVTGRKMRFTKSKDRSDCLEYEPATVKLSGKVVKEVHPGRPNFESVEKGDEKETCWYLHLGEPVCVKGGEENSLYNSPESNIRKVQLVLSSNQYKTYQTMENKNVIVTGQLFHSHTGHHHTPVLLTVKTMTANNPPGRLRENIK